VTNPERLSPDAWTLDSALLARPGNDGIQLDLFGDLSDQRRALSQIPGIHPYPAAAASRRLGQERPVLPAAGAQAFRRDNPDAEVHLLETGHFALESHAPEIATIIRDFFARKLPQSPKSS
jgi:pimeloyl-ACP methyl ester carboxylesterase